MPAVPDFPVTRKGRGFCGAGPAVCPALTRQGILGVISLNTVTTWPGTALVPFYRWRGQGHRVTFAQGYRARKAATPLAMEACGHHPWAPRYGRACLSSQLHRSPISPVCPMKSLTAALSVHCPDLISLTRPGPDQEDGIPPEVKVTVFG